VLLQLTDAGAVLEIPVPQGERRPPAGTAKEEGRRKQGKPRRRSRGPGEAPGRPPEEGAGGARAKRTKSAAQRTGGALGPCPLCGSEVVEQERSYGCSGWRAGCKFAIWKTVAGKKLSARTARALLREGRSPLLKGFKSKAGKRFDARLKLEGGAVRFDFEP
jgi:DNA topoisomerase III